MRTKLNTSSCGTETKQQRKKRKKYIDCIEPISKERRRVKMSNKQTN